MKWHAVKDKSGVYEIRRNDGEIFGGILINGKNRGVGFVGNVSENRYIFEFEDGMFSKSVKIFSRTKDNQIGTVKLGFTDSGTLETASGNYEWQALSSSKIWLDAEKNVVMFLDLENNADKSPSVLASPNIDAKTKELLMLGGWYLLVVEYRAGLTNSNLAGMPVKTDDFKGEQKSTHFNKHEVDWFDVITNAIDVSLD